MRNNIRIFNVWVISLHIFTGYFVVFSMMTCFLRNVFSMVVNIKIATLSLHKY